jgi:hypothetical protein
MRLSWLLGCESSRVAASSTDPAIETTVDTDEVDDTTTTGEDDVLIDSSESNSNSESEGEDSEIEQTQESDAVSEEEVVVEESVTDLPEIVDESTEGAIE